MSIVLSINWFEYDLTIKGSRLPQCIYEGQGFSHNIYNWNPKDCYNGAGRKYHVIPGYAAAHLYLLLNSIAFIIILLQILGAFAVRDGVPMQGMKIKNVVPGKIKVPVWIFSRANDSPTVLRLFRYFDVRTNTLTQFLCYADTLDLDQTALPVLQG